MSTNDKFKRVEAMLYNYKNTVAEIKILKRDLEILENDYRGTGAIGYEEKTGSTNKFNSDVENEVIKRAEKIQRLKSKIRLKEIGVENIDAALESLLKIALEGLDRILYNREFTIPKSVNDAWEDYEKRNNPILGFLEEGKIENESTKDVYLQYQTYCSENGLKHLSRIAFSREICKHGYVTKQSKVNGKRLSMFFKED